MGRVPGRSCRTGPQRDRGGQAPFTFGRRSPAGRGPGPALGAVRGPQVRPLSSILVDERFGGFASPICAELGRPVPGPSSRRASFREEAQLDELKEAGADAVLLLLRDLDGPRAAAMLSRAEELGLDALVEVS